MVNVLAELSSGLSPEGIKILQGIGDTADALERINPGHELLRHRRKEPRRGILLTHDYDGLFKRPDDTSPLQAHVRYLQELEIGVVDGMVTSYCRLMEVHPDHELLKLMEIDPESHRLEVKEEPFRERFMEDSDTKDRPYMAFARYHGALVAALQE